MKLFLGVLLAATIIGGFAGAEIFDTSFSIIGAVVGGLGMGAVLLGLGAYFSSNDSKSSKPSPEMQGIFDRMITGKENPTPQEIQLAKKDYLKSAKSHGTKIKKEQNSRFSIESAVEELLEQDAELYARGETPEARLIPHHAIKQDMVIAAYTKDFKIAEKHIIELDWSQNQKTQKITAIKMDFDKHIYGVKRLDWKDLDKIITLMKETRTDLKEIEETIRSQKPIYNIVERICA